MADLGFAGKSRNNAVFADVQPRADVLGQVFRMETAMAGSCFLRGERIFRDYEDRNACAKNLEEVAACKFELVERRSGELEALRLQNKLFRGAAHRPCSCINFAAWRTASIMRGCVPQRHTLPCKN